MTNPQEILKEVQRDRVPMVGALGVSPDPSPPPKTGYYRGFT